MKTLIFDKTLSGHHLEYLHHYYRGILSRNEDEYLICVPKDDFEKLKKTYEWPEAKNVSFSFLSKEEISKVENKKGVFKFIAESKLISKKSKELKADKVILTNFIHTIPYLLWFMPNKVKVRGIIYRIYLYSQKNLRYRIENFCYWLMARSKVMDKVFILNDQKSADRLNNIHNTDKFTFLPDPVPELEINRLENIREKYNINKENKVFLHFGGLAKRKGTLEILKAIIQCDKDQLRDKTFIFAGRVYNEMSAEFYELVDIAKQRTQILVFDEFCSYEFLHNLCYSSDVILMPYKQTNLSSGVLGYAAVFGKPVIGPKDGLIGDLIEKNKMGYRLPSITAERISDSFIAKVETKSFEYVNNNSVDAFIECIFN